MIEWTNGSRRKGVDEKVKWDGMRGYKRPVDTDNCSKSASIFTATDTGLRDFFSVSEAGSPSNSRSSDYRGCIGDPLSAHGAGNWSEGFSILASSVGFRFHHMAYLRRALARGASTTHLLSLGRGLRGRQHVIEGEELCGR